MPAYGVVDDQAGDVGVAADARHDFAVSVDTHSACSRGVEQLRVVLAFEFDRVLADGRWTGRERWVR